ncbi:MAG: hypothetical protein V2A76_05895 [Planctomycetota bacterium]
MPRATCFFFLALLAVGSHGFCGPGTADSARLVSRDSKMFLWTDDRAALLRRFRRVDAFQAIRDVIPSSLEADLVGAGAGLSIFLTPEILRAIPDLLSRGQGELALSVEGYVLSQGQPCPDILVVAGADGFEGVVEEISSLAAIPPTEGAELALSRLPFRLNAGSPVKMHVHRGVTIVQFVTAGGHSLALAESAGMLYGARSYQRVEMALDRSLRRPIGSLADSVRFQHAVKRLAPEAGSLCCYADLRRLRDQRTVHLLPQGIGRDLLVDGLNGFDGVGATLRGHGGYLELRAFLERASGSLEIVPLLCGTNSVSHALPLLPAACVVSLTFRDGGDRAGGMLASLNRFLGGIWSPEVLEDYLRALAGEEVAARIASKLGAELTLTIPTGPKNGEFFPRAVFMMESSDPRGLEDLLNGVVRRSSPASVRRLDLGGDAIFQVTLPRNGYFTELVLTVRDGFLIGSTRVMHLREFLGARKAGDSGLTGAESYQRPFDLLDHPASMPVSGLLFIDSSTAAVGAGNWLPACLRINPNFSRNPEAVRTLTHLVTALADPDLAGSFSGILVSSQSSTDGVLIEGVGP